MKLIHAAFEPAGQGPHPTIVAFHGWGANALDLLGLAPYIAGGRFLLLCPQGPLEVPIGALRGYGWYQITRGASPDGEQIEAAVASAFEYLDEAVARYPVQRRNLVLLGFSQGGVMAYSLAVRAPERFAGLVGLSTWFPPEIAARASMGEALSQLPTLVQHGRADDMIEIARARQSIESLRELGVPLTYREYACGHEITADALEDLSRFLVEKVLSPIITL